MSNPLDQRIGFTRSADNTNIAYALSGEGPPIVRAGTWLTHLQHDWDSPIWTHWFRLMSERNTLVRYDPRGCGLSQRDIDSLSLEHWVDDLEAVVNKLELERFPLFGMSQGAAVSILYALRHPERVSQLILYAPLVTGWRGYDNPLALRWSAMETLVSAGWGEENLAFPAMFAQLFLPDAEPMHVRWYAELQRKSTSKETAALIMQTLAEIHVFSRLKELDVPTLVIQVNGDQAVPPDVSKDIARVTDNAEFISIESRNHILLKEESGWQEFKHIYYKRIAGPCQDGARATTANTDQLLSLSERERQVLAQMARGLSNQDIADTLFISEKTVRNHITKIFSKINVQSRSQAIVFAKDCGL